MRVLLDGVRSAEPSSSSGMTGTSTSSTISLALRVATVGGSATSFSLSLRMTSASPGGRLRSITRRMNSLRSASGLASKRLSQSALALAPCLPTLRQAASTSSGISNGP